METLSQWMHLLVELFWWGFDLLFKLDDEMKRIVSIYGTSTHWILFAVIFCETGLVVTPFLPGDSLLFAAGAFAADGTLNIYWLLPMLCLAAVLGDAVNYSLGRWIGKRAFSGAIPFLKPWHFEYTQKYFDKFGNRTIIVARFVPIVRTFAPFMAGIGEMDYRRFAQYNVIGGLAWVNIFALLGFGFGKIPWVQKNFEVLMVAIVFLSLLPPLWEWWQHRKASQAEVAEANTASSPTNN